jgi:hypothetical protein
MAAEQVRLLRERITDEVFQALGFSKTGLVRRSLGWLVRLPTQRFSSLFASADLAARDRGLQDAGRELLKNLSVPVAAMGAETLPLEGPLIVASNHPGAYDSAALAASIPRRDVKIIVYEIPFYHALEYIQQCMIFVNPDPNLRMSAIREAVDHLRSGGALIQFGTGRIDPDPSVLEGSAETLKNWSPSLEIMLRKVPQTRLSLAVVSGVLLERFTRHPLTRLRRHPIDQRRIAEFMQVISQLVSGKAPGVQPRITFAPPVDTSVLQAESKERWMESILRRAQTLLAEHTAAVDVPG